jgi:hypothetical protein
MTTHPRQLAFGVVAVIIGLWVAQIPAAGQSQPAAAKPSAAKTPWGHPDLQGTWTTWDLTPLQGRNPDAAEAAAESEDNSREVFVYNGQEYKYQGLGSGMGREHTSPVSPRRQSLVYDPANGRIPVIPSKRLRRSQSDVFVDYRNNNAWTRCLSMGVPGRLLNGAGGGYNKAYEIFQTPNAVVIHHEMLHETRVIPLDGRPHVSQDVRMWLGDSRGRWEGQTLVVDTTNFNGRGDAVGGVPQTEGLHVVERFTRVDQKTLQYEVTVTDPNVYSQPWSAKQFHNLDPSYVIYEYACHEGNMRYMEQTLGRGALEQEAGK